MARGIQCPQCGASTPLPDDLRVPTFQCAFCQTSLPTAKFAGAAAVSADALVGFIGTLAEDPRAAMANIHEAPRFDGGSRELRAMTCMRCSASVQVPLDLQVREFACEGCGVTQAIDDYIPHEERFRLDMERQVAGNEALRRIQADGVPCGRCGGQNAVPDDGSVQFTCSFCQAVILLSDHADASAVARQRMKHGSRAVRAELQRQHEAQVDRSRRIAAAIVVVVVLAILVANVVTR